MKDNFALNAQNTLSEELLLFSLFSVNEQERAAKPKQKVGLVPVLHHLMGLQQLGPNKEAHYHSEDHITGLLGKQYSSGRTQQKYAKTPNPTAKFSICTLMLYAEGCMGQLLGSLLLYEKAQTTCSLSIGAGLKLTLCLTSISCILCGDFKFLYEYKNNFSKICQQKEQRHKKFM